MLRELFSLIATMIVIPFLHRHGVDEDTLSYCEPLLASLGSHIDNKLTARKQRQLPPKSTDSS